MAFFPVSGNSSRYQERRKYSTPAINTFFGSGCKSQTAYAGRICLAAIAGNIMRKKLTMKKDAAATLCHTRFGFPRAGSRIRRHSPQAIPRDIPGQKQSRTRQAARKVTPTSTAMHHSDSNMLLRFFHTPVFTEGSFPRRASPALWQRHCTRVAPRIPSAPLLPVNTDSLGSISQKKARLMPKYRQGCSSFLLFMVISLPRIFLQTYSLLLRHIIRAIPQAMGRLPQNTIFLLAILPVTDLHIGYAKAFQTAKMQQ